MDEKLIDLENELILVYPARLQRDPYTKMQFKENEYEQYIEFTIKASDGKPKLFRVYLIDNKFYSFTKDGKDGKYKKSKDIIKIINEVCKLR
jgi:hypothetical protein